MRPDLGIAPPELEVTDAAPGWIKPIVLMIVLVVLGAGIAAWKAHWPGGDWEHDFDAGLDTAENTGKPMLVLYTADWCPPCRTLKRTVLQEPEVVDQLKQRYVLVKVDLSNRSGPNAELAAYYDVTGIPTVILFGPGGDEIDRVTGGGSLASWFRMKARQ